MVKISNVNFSTFGNCLEISNGEVVVRVTTEIGPRIIYFGSTDEQNMMYNDVDGKNVRPSEFLTQNYGEGEAWRIYGGHRLWKSPEDEASYQPDHYEVEVIPCENGATFYSASDMVTGIKKGIKVTMADDGAVTVEQSFFNCGKKVLNIALWGLSVMNKNGIAIVPMSKENTGLLPNRNLVFWPYTDVKDERLTIAQDYVSLRQDPNCNGPIKIGMLNTEGLAYYLKDDKLVEKIYGAAKRDGNYADYCCSTELYTAEDFVEVESLSEVMQIKPGETVSNQEIWKLHIKDDLYDKIKAMVNEK